MRKNRVGNYIYPVLTAVFIGVFEAVLFYFLDLKVLVLPIAVVFDVNRAVFVRDSLSETLISHRTSAVNAK